MKQQTCEKIVLIDILFRCGSPHFAQKYFPDASRHAQSYPGIPNKINVLTKIPLNTATSQNI